LFVCLSVLHITVSLLRLYFDLCLFSCLFTLIVVFVIYCFVLSNVANKDLHTDMSFCMIIITLDTVIIPITVGC